MKTITVLSSSVREGRLSHRVALYLKHYLENHTNLGVELLDLKKYDFPIFDERLAMLKHPSEALLDFTKRFVETDALIIVSPVYNAGFPASLKNVIDLYYKEWKRKLTAVVSVSSGQVPGIATAQQLQTLLLKLGALVTPVLCTVTQVERHFDPVGKAAEPEMIEALMRPLLNELFWLLEKTQE